MILVIDNYDSFTFNLVHYIEELGWSTHVERNDTLTPSAALALNPRAIVLSPGPCTPNEAGICLDLIAHTPADLPLLGVCLGHQALGQAMGGHVVPAKEIVHGRTSAIHHNGAGMFAGLPQGFKATRYHSLSVAREGLPETLCVDAWTEDGEIMALRHTDRPMMGVQFHPESIASEHGHAMLKHFLDLAGAPA
jgi:anthranilate synthase component II